MFDSVTLNSYAGDMSVNLLFLTIFDNWVSVKRSERNQQISNICALCKIMSMKFRFHFVLYNSSWSIIVYIHTFSSDLLLLNEE